MSVVETRELPRESVELVRPVIEIDGVDVSDTVAYEIAEVGTGQRPTTWVDPTVAGELRGYLTGTLTEGTYDLWVRVIDSPERPAYPYARLRIT